MSKSSRELSWCVWLFPPALLVCYCGRKLTPSFPSPTAKDTCGPHCHRKCRSTLFWFRLRKAMLICSTFFFLANKCDGQPIYCTCNDCTQDIWDSVAGDFPCGERIRSQQRRNDLNLDERGACQRVSEEYPSTYLTGAFSVFVPSLTFYF